MKAVSIYTLDLVQHYITTECEMIFISRDNGLSLILSHINVYIYLPLSIFIDITIKSKAGINKEIALFSDTLDFMH